MKSERLSARTLKSLFAMSGNRCFWQGCNRVIVGPNGSIFGKVKKIPADQADRQDQDQSETDTHWLAPDELVLLCSDCDKRLSSKPMNVTIANLRKTKRRHEAQFGRASIPNDAWIALQLLKQSQAIGALRSFVVDAEGQAIERVLNSQPEASDVTAVFHQSQILEDQLACAYIAYLIKRYNEFAAKERGGGQLNPKAIGQNLETRYKTKWKQVPRVRFPDVCRYLKQRIDRTQLGRRNLQKGRQSYRSYSEFLLRPHR